MVFLRKLGAKIRGTRKKLSVLPKILEQSLKGNKSDHKKTLEFVFEGVTHELIRAETCHTFDERDEDEGFWQNQSYSQSFSRCSDDLSSCSDDIDGSYLDEGTNFAGNKNIEMMIDDEGSAITELHADYLKDGTKEQMHIIKELLVIAIEKAINDEDEFADLVLKAVEEMKLLPSLAVDEMILSLKKSNQGVWNQFERRLIASHGRRKS